MSYEDDSKYDFLPYLDRNLGRVFVPGDKQNTKLFIRDFRETEFGARLVNEGLDTGENLDAILAATQERFEREEVNMTQYVQVAKSLWMLGDLKPKAAPVAQAPTPKPLSASQQAWREYREFTDSHSVKECKERARVDVAYRNFLEKNLQREMSGGVGDAVVAVGTQAVRQDKSIKVDEDLLAFATAYRRTSAAEVRRMSSPLTNELGHKQYTDLLDRCIAAGLI